MTSCTTLLGFTDEPISADENVTSYTSKLGGQAVVSGGTKLFLQCQECTTHRCRLVCQIYCPIDNIFHRTLYVFACPSATCHHTNKGWRILRIQSRVSSHPSDSSTKVDVRVKLSDRKTNNADDWGKAADDWGEAADDWGEAADDWVETADDWVETADKETRNEWVKAADDCGTVFIDNSPSAATADCELDDCLLNAVAGLTISSSSSNDDHYDPYYISVDEESDNSNVGNLSKDDKQLLDEYERCTDSIVHNKGSRMASAAEHYEKSSVAHGNKVFYKFIKTLSKSPTQIIRYDYSGAALPMSNMDEDCIPRCEYCGARRTFELQLMPTLLQALTTHGKALPLDVGTVIVFSCSRSCWTGKPVNEHIIVQHDPDEHLFSRF